MLTRSNKISMLRKIGNVMTVIVLYYSVTSQTIAKVKNTFKIS